MKNFLLFIATLLSILHAAGKEPLLRTPLSTYSKEWNDPKYQACNTAAHTSYLTTAEKELIFIMNLARTNPKLFCKTILPNVKSLIPYTDTTSELYYKSLVKEMNEMDPLVMQYPDSLTYLDASCHAMSSAANGYAGHDRQTEECKRKSIHFGECCVYGFQEPLKIVLRVLIDQGVEDLGHRRTCFKNFPKIAPAIRPHTAHSYVAVIDYYWH